ncbi:acylphosphatase [Stenotrophomonas panacihumi]|uniref:acylphosphatase n=1 Tax=Stenotrophomonas panacihumi TaxID=676599 RepID=A0A0R0ABC2_9GAMM|nr:acylphosphatase [Stenotrophomonas panacihumi]KRG38152.1 acylphosphatase [Stenotrophomonas panacihumi]PTN54005.1 acylphosphatase [Stenotrophomonas panacihumi]
MAQASFRVGGRVQGVGFRAWTRDQAVALGLDGHAFNLPGGDVDVVVAGEAAAIDALAARLLHGPALARVDRLDRQAHDAPVAPGFLTG